MNPSFRIIILKNLFLDRVKFIGLFIRLIDRVNFDSRKSGNRVDRDWGFMYECEAILVQTKIFLSSRGMERY